MPFYRVVQFFKLGENGWTETLYKEEGNVSNAWTAARALRVARCKLLSKQVTHKGFRIAQIDGPNIGVKLEFFTNDANTGLDADAMVIGALVRATLDNGVRKSLTLRGFPDDYFQSPAANRMPAMVVQGQNAIGIYGQFLRDNVWMIRASDKVDLTQNQHKITGWGNLDGRLYLETMAALGAVRGDGVTIAKASGLPSSVLKTVNTRQFVYSAAGNQIVLALPITSVPDFTDLRGGVIWLNTPHLRQIQQTVYVRPTTRLTGKYPLVQRARQKKRFGVI